MSSLYEDAQEQVTTLTKQLAEREAALADQSAAQAREKNLLAAAEDAKRGAISQAQHASASAELARQESLDARTLLQNALKRAAEAERKLAEHQASVEAESRAAAESARRAEQARMTLTSVQKGAESARAAIAEAEHRVDAAVAAKEAAEADAERLRKRMDKLRRMTESDGNSLLQEQLKWYKDQVKCPIIRSENKEVCLIKCGHMYSRKCVDGLIQQRSACGRQGITPPTIVINSSMLPGAHGSRRRGLFYIGNAPLPARSTAALFRCLLVRLHHHLPQPPPPPPRLFS